MAALTLDYGKWELDGMTEIHDVVTCGPVAPSLSAVLAMDDLLEGEAQSARSRQLLAVGKHPMAAFYVVEEQHSSFTTAVSRASTVATKLTSAVFSLARTWWASAPKEEYTSALCLLSLFSTTLSQLRPLPRCLGPAKLKQNHPNRLRRLFYLHSNPT